MPPPFLHMLGTVQYSCTVQPPELGTRSFFRGSLSAPHSIFSPGSLTLMRSFFEFPYSLVAQTLVAHRSLIAFERSLNLQERCAQLWQPQSTTLKLHCGQYLHYKPVLQGEGGEVGKLWALVLFSTPVILLPLNIINSINISDLYSIIYIYTSNI